MTAIVALHARPEIVRGQQCTTGALLAPTAARRQRWATVGDQASLPNVALSVLPYGPGRMPLLHPFVMWELEGETLITVETYSAELQVRDPTDVQRYQEVWARLVEGAVGVMSGSGRMGERQCGQGH
jgi:hypothetical protein